MKSFLVCLFDDQINSQIFEFRKQIMNNKLGNCDLRADIPFHITLAYFDDPHTDSLKQQLDLFISQNPPYLQNIFKLQNTKLEGGKVIADFSSEYWKAYSDKLYFELSNRVIFEPNSKQFAANHAKVARYVFNDTSDQLVTSVKKTIPKTIKAEHVVLVDLNLNKL